MTKYVKLPIEVEATQWFKHGDHGAVAINSYCCPGTELGEINTLEGDMLVIPGDWIITGVNGEVYPCKDDIFRATYKEVGK